MSKFERKFGKYAIKNLTLILIGCYVIGYIMQYVNSNFLNWLTLDVYQIITKIQVWRVITWIIVPPETFDIFTVIMLFFYYSIGTTMERTMGTYKYNVFIFRGILVTVLFAFLCFAFSYFLPALLPETRVIESLLALSLGEVPTKLQTLQAMWQVYSLSFSTYYINMSIFLAFAIVYPEMQVLLMFVIPIKVKWLGILDLVLLGYSFIVGGVFGKFAIGAALINVAIFFFMVRNLSHLRPSQIKRRAEFQHKVQKAQSITKHKCAICGQTEYDDPNLEFRFCSKCNGNYEYCEKHLYTHEHVK
ncbi:MAG: hypothetical protein J5546_11870 [Lachnospiraceae bacterium]|nr:hypothetical protein [Lachnospiraceae bacterium]